MKDCTISTSLPARFTVHSPAGSILMVIYFGTGDVHAQHHQPKASATIALLVPIMSGYGCCMTGKSRKIACQCHTVCPFQSPTDSLKCVYRVYLQLNVDSLGHGNHHAVLLIFPDHNICWIHNKYRDCEIPESQNTFIA